MRCTNYFDYKVSNRQNVKDIVECGVIVLAGVFSSFNWLIFCNYCLRSLFEMPDNKYDRYTPVCGRLLFAFAVISFVLISFQTQVLAKSQRIRIIDNIEANSKYAAFVMDADTGFVLYQKNANKRLHPASLTKMMTLLMLFDALEKGEVGLNTRIKISEHAASMIPSKLGLKAGESIKVKHAIQALVTKSANDVAVAVAEKLGGSERNFALMMSKKAKELGMKRTRFRNASGLHDPWQVSTARDMAILGRVLVNDYRKYYRYFSMKKFTYKGKTYKNHNKLMDRYEGMDGLKTGYINKSGFNLVSSAVRGNHRLIGVVFGGKTGKSRNAQMERLLNQSFAKIGALQIAKGDIPVPPRKPFVSTLPNTSRWAMLDTINESSMFNRMIGQGDYDINVRNRIETGLIAISSHMKEEIPDHILADTVSAPVYTYRKSNAKTKTKEDKNWSVQIGAFTSRMRANKAIAQSIRKLPSHLDSKQHNVAPLKTAQGWIFRSRLNGYTKQKAREICKILDDCITISPNVN